MSRNPVLGGACIVMAATAIIWCAWNAARPLRLPWAAPPTPPHTDGPVEVAAASDSAVAAAIRAGGFRQARSLAPMSFGQPVAEAPPTPAPPKPSLALVGLVLGRSRTLLLTGIPGSPGTRLLNQGDTAGGLRVRSISSAGRVIIAGYDTVWTFRPPEEPK